MQKNIIKALLLLVLYAGSAKPLSKNDVKKWALGGGIGIGVLAGGVSSYCTQNIQIEKAIALTCAVALGAGLLSRWVIKKYLKPFTPQRRWIQVQDLLAALKNDLQDKSKKSTYRTLKAIQNIRKLLEGIVHETASDESLKGLHETCVKKLGDIVTLEAKVSRKISYNNAVKDLNIAADADFVTKKIDIESLLSYSQMRFGTNWPLVVACNNLKMFFDYANKSKNTFEKILQGDGCSTKMINKCNTERERAEKVIKTLEVLMNMVLSHQNYQEQVKLQEADHDRRVQQALLEKKLAHERQLELERQNREDARQQRAEWRKWDRQWEKNRRKANSRHKELVFVF